jgi:hypothetical protein
MGVICSQRWLQTYHRLGARMTNEAEKTVSDRQLLETIEASVNSYAASYKLYKGVTGRFGAFQMDLTPLHRSKKDIGAVFIQMAPTTGKNEYNWEQKITFACGISDIAKMLEATVGSFPKDKEGIQQDYVDIFHDTHAGTENKGQLTKSLRISKDKEGRGLFFNLSQKENGTSRNVNVPISNGELLIMKALLERAVVRILAW